MGHIRTGAEALGLDVQWRYAFVGPGKVCQPAPDGVYLDVGGTLCPGVLDQHHERSLAASTSELVLRYPAHVYDHLMLDWLHRARSGEDLAGRVWSPVIITHYAPDFDAVVSSLLVLHLVRHGGFPVYAKALVEYSSSVDQGRYRVSVEDPSTATSALHMAYLAIQHLPAPEGVSCAHTWRIQQGHQLIESAMGLIETARTSAGLGPLRDGGDLGVHQPGVADWRSIPEYADAAALLDGDLEKHRRDMAKARLCSTLLPAQRGPGAIEVPTAIFLQPTESALNKYWVRADGYPYFICPASQAGAAEADEVDGEPRYPRVFLSLDPTWSSPMGKPTLQGLGFTLENMEVRYRTEVLGGDQRLGTPRFQDGSCTNDDPWYDGRGHDYTIIDAPRNGTLMPYSKVVDIGTSAFWRLPLTEAEVVVIRSSGGRGEIDSERGAPVRPFQGMAQTLQSYLSACTTVELPVQEGSGGGPGASPLPPGFRHAPEERRLRRTFPPHTAPPIEIELFIADDGTATLDELVDWVRERRTHSVEAFYICAWLRVGKHFLSPERVDAMLLEMGGGEASPQDSIEAGAEVVLFNEQSVIVHQAQGSAAATSAASSRERLRAYQEFIIYAVFLNESLIHFSHRVSQAIDTGGKLHGSSQIRSDFLYFQTQYYHLQVTHDPHQRRFYQRVVDGLQVPIHYLEVQSELDRLGQAAERASSHKMELLLFVIGLAGVVEALLALPNTGEDWVLGAPTTPDELLRLFIMLAGVGGAVLLYWLFRKRSKERESLDGR